ncbi:hypothetical protein A2881_04455 [Candidatus Peribacteria bacterium RIFCSPHIGHO2_01_FULL_55_13]|nr:MAG: hypothetical protein A2881_04455 [Candidatus Peribacteria bacterium RIFCSPHIGHO2_01_FULL_55_13]
MFAQGYEAFLLCSVAVLGVILDYLSRIAMKEYFMILPKNMQNRLCRGEYFRELPPPAALKKMGNVTLLLGLRGFAKIWFLVLVWKASQPVATAIVVMYAFDAVVGLALWKASSTSPPVVR